MLSGRLSMVLRLTAGVAIFANWVALEPVVGLLPGLACSAPAVVLSATRYRRGTTTLGLIVGVLYTALWPATFFLFPGGVVAGLLMAFATGMDLRHSWRLRSAPAKVA